MSLTWDDVLKRTDLIGGDIESIEDGVPYRGPLSEMRREGNMIVFESPWVARMSPETGEWESWHITHSSINAEVEPQDIGQQRVMFYAPLLGPTTLFPKGGSKLDPAKVKGFALTSA